MSLSRYDPGERAAVMSTPRFHRTSSKCWQSSRAIVLLTDSCSERKCSRCSNPPAQRGCCETSSARHPTAPPATGNRCSTRRSHRGRCTTRAESLKASTATAHRYTHMHAHAPTGWTRTHAPTGWTRTHAPTGWITHTPSGWTNSTAVLPTGMPQANPHLLSDKMLAYIASRITSASTPRKSAASCLIREHHFTTQRPQIRGQSQRLP